MESWQWILFAFLVLLPMMLMLDYWGSERLTFRGTPVERDWKRQIDHEPADESEH